MEVLNLKEVAKWLHSTLIGAEHAKEAAITGVSTDTRSLVPGDLFVAIRGEHYDGHQFLKDAASKGAVAALVDTPPYNQQASSGGQTGLLVHPHATIQNTASNVSRLPYEEQYDHTSSANSMHLPLIPVADTLQALGEIARRYRALFNIPIAAITGSCGKTTVKEMLARILAVRGPTLASRGNLNTEIGVPLSLLRLDSSHQTAVIEMGARKVGDIRYLMKIAEPTVTVITNVGTAHLEIFGSERGIAETKGEIYAELAENGTAVLNVDSPYADYWKSLLKNQKIITFGLGDGVKDNIANISCSDVVQTAASSKFILRTPSGEVEIELAAPGEHNIRNALTAAAAAFAMHIPLADIKKGLELFTPVLGRLQIKYGKQGIRVIDDTYNANPQSVKAALAVLAAYAPNTIFVMGDMLELGKDTEKMHREIGEFAKRLNISRMFGFGPLTKFAIQGFGENGIHFADKPSLIHSLTKSASTDSTILIKGSRGMRMEEVVQNFTEQLRENNPC